MDKSLPYHDWENYLDVATTKNISMCFKSLVEGVASPDQQKMAVDFLIKIGCRTYDTDWFKDERTSSFAAGRRYVGMQIARFINLKLGTLKEK